jgi:hypothetical protein
VHRGARGRAPTRRPPKHRAAGRRAVAAGRSAAALRGAHRCSGCTRRLPAPPQTRAPVRRACDRARRCAFTSRAVCGRFAVCMQCTCSVHACDRTRLVPEPAGLTRGRGRTGSRQPLALLRPSWCRPRRPRRPRRGGLLTDALCAPQATRQARRRSPPWQPAGNCEAPTKARGGTRGGARRSRVRCAVRWVAQRASAMTQARLQRVRRHRRRTCRP